MGGGAMVGQIENVENMYECVGIDVELAFHSFLSYLLF